MFSYLILIQISFYIFDFSNINEIKFLILTFPILALVIKFSYEKVQLLLGIIGIFTPLFLIYFIIICTPQNYYNSKDIDNNISKNIGDIFIITAEKITAPMILNKDYTIRDDFVNLKKLSKESTIFSNLHTQTIRTTGGLQAIMLGKGLKLDTPSGTGRMRGLDLREGKSIIDLHSQGRKVFVYNDYTGDRYCDPRKHSCIKIFLKNKPSIRFKFLEAFYWEYFDTIFINKILTIIKKPRLNFFEDLYIIDNDPLKYPKQQFEVFLDNLETTKSPSMFVMHSFLTDGYFKQDFGYKKENLKKNEQIKFKRIKIFDEYIGKLVNRLKKKKRFTNSLILITSDTGSDQNAFKTLMDHKTINHPYNKNISNIFGIIHFNGQNDATINKNLVYQKELFSIINYSLENRKYIYSSLFKNYKLMNNDFFGIKGYKINNKQNTLYRED